MKGDAGKAREKTGEVRRHRFHPEEIERGDEGREGEVRTIADDDELSADLGKRGCVLGTGDDDEEKGWRRGRGGREGGTLRSNSGCCGVDERRGTAVSAPASERDGRTGFCEDMFATGRAAAASSSSSSECCCSYYCVVDRREGGRKVRGGIEAVRR